MNGSEPNQDWKEQDIEVLSGRKEEREKIILRNPLRKSVINFLLIHDDYVGAMVALLFH